MTEIILAPNVRLVDADALAVSTAPPGGRRGVGREQAVDDALDAALAGAFEVDADVVLAPSGRRSAPGATPRVEVGVEPDQSAVLLVESGEGVLRWAYPEKGAVADPVGRRSAGGGSDGPLVFALDDGASDRQQAGDGRRGLLDWVGDRLIDPVRIRVLRFLAARTVDALKERLEGGHRSGLVVVDGDPSAWTPSGDGARLSGLASPTDAPRVLLMVHGTFSSTAGSFAALAATEEGRRFLDGAKERYDLVLGYDHRTLDLDPIANASDLAAELERRLPDGAQIDAVAYSRGGLVLRALIERIAPAGLGFRRAVFVGCTNAGTSLAEPENWRVLADLYVNLLVAGARAVALLGGEAVAPFIVFAVKTLGRFVQILPEVAVHGERVPGLAAMRPDGDFLTELNAEAAGRDGVVEPSYCVIGADFEARIEPGRAMTGELARFLVDRVADRFFGRDNDLVVDTESMTSFGGRAGRHDQERTRLIAPADAVFHTIYFASPAVAGLLSEWLLDDGRTRGVASALEDEPPDSWARRGSGLAPPNVDRDGAWGFGRSADAAMQPGPPRRGVDATTVDVDRGDRRTAQAAPAPASDAAPQMDCHFAAEMDRAPDIAGPVPLFVSVSRERLLVRPGPTAAVTEAVPLRADQVIEVEVIALENCAVEGEPLCKVAVPSGGTPPTILRFLVKGEVAGSARVQVEARQDGLVLASFILEPHFLDWADHKIRVTQVTPISPPERSAVLRIYEMKRDGQLRIRYDLSSADPNIAVTAEQEFPASFNDALFAADLIRKLEQAYNKSDRSYDLLATAFADEAASATHDLIPEKIRRGLWRCGRDAASIQVIADSAHLPWELFLVDDPDAPDIENGAFLAEWGLTRWMYNAPVPPARLPIRSGRAHYVVPRYLSRGDELAAADREGEMLAKLFGAQSLQADSSTVRNYLSKQARECDLLHFTCHGQVKTGGVVIADLLLSDQRDEAGATLRDTLSHHAVWRAARFGDNGPSGMVFVNACQTGRPGDGVVRVSGFADAFLRPKGGHGAAAFVGALWSVGDVQAFDFASRLYKRMKEGDRLADAVRSAREAGKKQGDFTWLSYTVYGNPQARLALDDAVVS
ncbi:CHAT domain-containing protein [Sphingomonas sp. IW22]|uniref:DUF7379 domain-containing protein n=1 Tax=Sphingomonas sp. IW22 TaxID=3242489 RepID=UPI003522ECAD